MRAELEQLWERRKRERASPCDPAQISKWEALCFDCAQWILQRLCKDILGYAFVRNPADLNEPQRFYRLKSVCCSFLLKAQGGRRDTLRQMPVCWALLPPTGRSGHVCKIKNWILLGRGELSERSESCPKNKWGRQWHIWPQIWQRWLRSSLVSLKLDIENCLHLSSLFYFMNKIVKMTQVSPKPLKIKSTLPYKIRVFVEFPSIYNDISLHRTAFHLLSSLWNHTLDCENTTRFNQNVQQTMELAASLRERLTARRQRKKKRSYVLWLHDGGGKQKRKIRLAWLHRWTHYWIQQWMRNQQLDYLDARGRLRRVL